MIENESCLQEMMSDKCVMTKASLPRNAENPEHTLLVMQVTRIYQSPGTRNFGDPTQNELPTVVAKYSCSTS